MKKSEILQKVLDKMLTELRALKSVLREDEWDYMECGFSTFKKIMNEKIYSERLFEKNEEAE